MAALTLSLAMLWLALPTIAARGEVRAAPTLEAVASPARNVVPDGPLVLSKPTVRSTKPRPAETPEPTPPPPPSPQQPPAPPTVANHAPAAPAPTTEAPEPRNAHAHASRPVTVAPLPAGPGPTTTIYMAPGGSDSADGSTPDQAVATFARAQQRAAAAGVGNVDILLAPGEYRVGAATWWHPIEGYRLRIMPDTFDGEAVTASQRPVFVGSGAGPYWLDVSPRGGGGAVEVVGVEVRGYANGLRISGGFDNSRSAGSLAASTGRPVRALVTRSEFTRIGSAHSPRAGFAAVHLQNTRSPAVVGNVFDRVENGAPRASYVHGVYAVASSDITVAANSFTAVSGDPVRVRHRTSGEVAGNAFDRAGTYAAISDWFCDRACAARASQAPECPSSSVTVADNRVGRGYRGGPVPQWTATVSASGAARACR